MLAFARTSGLQRWERARGLTLLLAVGLLFGLAVPLSKVAAELEPNPIGLTLWVNLLISIGCLSVATIRRTLPSFNLRLLKFIVLWGLYGTVLGEVLIFWVVQQVPAATLSLVIVCEGFIVYLCTLIRREQSPGLINLLGLATGLCGVALLVLGQQDAAIGGSPMWILIAFLIPTVFAAEDLLLANRMPLGLDVVAGAGLSALAGTLILLPVAGWFDAFVDLNGASWALGLAILGIALSSAVGTILMVRLMTSTGAIFGSQTGYTIMCSGVLWSIVLLSERPGPWLWLALLVLITGLILVEPEAKSDIHDRLP